MNEKEREREREREREERAELDGDRLDRVLRRDEFIRMNSKEGERAHRGWRLTNKRRRYYGYFSTCF